jgi:hypothetical protein
MAQVHYKEFIDGVWPYPAFAACLCGIYVLSAAIYHLLELF